MTGTGWTRSKAPSNWDDEGHNSPCLILRTISTQNWWPSKIGRTGKRFINLPITIWMKRKRWLPWLQRRRLFKGKRLMPRKEISCLLGNSIGNQHMRNCRSYCLLNWGLSGPIHSNTFITVIAWTTRILDGLCKQISARSPFVSLAPSHHCVLIRLRIYIWLQGSLIFLWSNKNKNLKNKRNQLLNQTENTF